MATGSNPYIATYEATWDMLEGNEDFASLVKVGNRIKFDKDSPIKADVSTADKPEVRLVPTDLNPERNARSIIQACSSAALTVLQLELQIGTGEQRLFRAGTAAGRQTMFDVLWEAQRAAMDWPSYFTSMTWGTPTVDFKVNHIIVSAASMGVLLEDQLERSIRGWSALMSIDVSMTFPLVTHRP